MNRTDRLAALVMLLQSRRVITAAQLAGHFGLTERTIYRDLVALGEAGVPIIGEAGVGYSLRRGYHLPPVMFSPAEAMALATGGLLAERMTDASVGESIRLALGKVSAVLPPDLQDQVNRLRRAMLVPGRPVASGPVPLSRLQTGMAEGRVMRLHYRGAKREAAHWREVEPLGLVYYLDHWHLIAWCRMRGDVRDFRADRILDCELLAETVAPRRGFDLADHLAKGMVPEGSETAVLDVAPLVLESVRRHWGPAVRQEVPGHGVVRVTLTFCGTDYTYLASWLMSFCRNIRIVQPEQLRERLVELALETAGHHQSPAASQDS
ncbi:MAG: YafY family protein [Verrucomicrobiota bacterium]